MYLENGSALSRANDQVIRDALATNPTTAQIPNPAAIAAIAVLPEIDPVP